MFVVSLVGLTVRVRKTMTAFSYLLQLFLLFHPIIIYIGLHLIVQVDIFFIQYYN